MWGFHSSVSLNNLFTIPFIASPLGGGGSINSDTFSRRFCRLVGSSSAQEKKKCKLKCPRGVKRRRGEP